MTPKGDAATKRLPSKVVAVYAALALGAVLPVILVSDVGEARGFHLLSGINALIYSSIVISIVVRHLRDNSGELKKRWYQAIFQLCSAASLGILIIAAVMVRGTESLYALSVGLEPFRIARAEYSASGAGMNDYKRIHYRFDPGWN